MTNRSLERLSKSSIVANFGDYSHQKRRLYSVKYTTVGDCQWLLPFLVTGSSTLATVVAEKGDYSHRKWRQFVTGNGGDNLLPISGNIVAVFGDYSRQVASVDKALSPHFAAPLDCRLRWSAPSTSTLYASGRRQTICLQLTHAVGLHAKTCQLHKKNLVETLKAL